MDSGFTGNNGRFPLAWGSVLAATAAAVALWDQQKNIVNNKKTTDCCGIIGVVAHPGFDTRYVGAIQVPYRPGSNVLFA